MPLQIGSNVSVKQYNKFLERKAPRGYKYQLRENGDVFVIDMSNSEHGTLVAFLITLFNIHNAIFIGSDNCKRMVYSLVYYNQS